MFPTLPFIYFLICGLTGLFLWYKMLRIMESKGRKVNFFLVTIGQYTEFNRIIKEEQEVKIKAKYRLLLWSQIVLLPVYLFGVLFLFRLT